MIPLRSSLRRSRPAVVTGSLVALNLLAFLFELKLGRELPQFIRLFGLRPALFSTYWWTFSPFVWVPFFSSMFLHAGWLHLAGNMLFLWVFGRDVEEYFGGARFFTLYLLSGLGASFVQVWMTPDSPVPGIGASGAIAGVLGAYLLLFPRSRVMTLVVLIVFPLFVELPAVLLLAVWFAGQFASGVASLETGEALYGGVAYWGHVGGFLSGVALALLLGGGDLLRDRYA